MANTTKTLRTGDILEYNVGYSMILPHFVVIEGFTPSGKSAYVRELKADFEPADPPYNQRGWKTPTNIRIGERKTCRVKNTSYGPCVKIDGHGAWPWNGEPAEYDSMD